MEIAGHLWQFLTQTKHFACETITQSHVRIADYICGQKSPVINRNHSGIFLFEIIKIIFHGDCWSFMAIPD